jgi:hypothetical protein
VSAADEALRVLIVQHELLDERAAGHVYRQAIAAGSTLHTYLLEQKILEPEDLVMVVEEREKNAVPCKRCDYTTYLLPGQSAQTLMCVRCKEPLSGRRRRVARPTDGAFQVVTARKSKLPLVVGTLLFAAAAGGLYYAYQKKVGAKDRSPKSGATKTPGTVPGEVDGPPTPEGDQIELEVLTSQLTKAAAAGDWGPHFDCFSTGVQPRMALNAILSARKAVAKDASLAAEWKDICGAHYWIRSETSDEQALSLKVTMKLSQNEQRQLYLDIQTLLKTQPTPQKNPKLKGLRIEEGRAHARIIAEADSGTTEQKVEFVFEDEEWRIGRLWR